MIKVLINLAVVCLALWSIVAVWLWKKVKALESPNEEIHQLKSTVQHQKYGMDFLQDEVKRYKELLEDVKKQLSNEYSREVYYVEYLYPYDKLNLAAISDAEVEILAKELNEKDVILVLRSKAKEE